MSIGARFALALAMLAALSVAAVGTTSYLQTEDRLREEVDASLRSDAKPLLRPSDPTGFIALSLCNELATSHAGVVSNYAARVSKAQGSSLQCVSETGEVLGWTGAVDLPVKRPSALLRVHAPTLGSITHRGVHYRFVAVPGPNKGTIRVSRSLTHTEDVLSTIRNRAIYIGLGVIALAALLGFFIARRVTRPVVRLTGAAEQVAATGNLDASVPAGRRRDEIGRLSRAFGTMLSALQASRAQQQQLVEDASHELRTPLTSLRTNLDTLRKHDDLTPELRQRVLGDMDTELKELDTLTTEIVELAVEHRESEPDTEIALDQLMETLAERTRRRTGRDVRVHSTPTTVLGRPEALSRAFANLLDNATKFTPEGTPIDVDVTSGRVQVRDHGPGIAPENLPHIFDRFYRAVDARSLPGSGLGLSIVRAIVEENGGHVAAENCPDGGAAFTVELPVAGAATT